MEKTWVRRLEKKQTKGFQIEVVPNPSYLHWDLVVHDSKP
jgi:hypothetical protein